MILGASFDAPAANEAFATAQRFPFDILCDTDRSVGLAYGVAADAKAGYPKRVTFVIGADGRLEHVIEKVDPRSHPATLLESLK